MKWTLRIAAVGVALAIALAAVALWIAQSDWVRERARNLIVQETERATGGRVELGTFRFDWHTLTADVDRFVLHGTEPAGSAPLVSVKHASIQLEVLSLVRRDFRIRKSEAIQPDGHLIVAADGQTNIPRPKVRNAGKGVAQMILDLKIGAFDLRQGSILLEVAGQPPKILPWDARGENLTAQVAYEELQGRYSGTVSLAPLHLKQFDIELQASASMEADRILITRALLKTGESEVELRNTMLSHFAAPVWTGQYQAKLALKNFTRLARGTVNAVGTARYVSLSDYHAAGNVTSTDFGIDVFRNMRVQADFEADTDKVAVKRARVQTLGGEITGAGELLDFERFKASGQLAHFNLAQVVAKVVAQQTKQKLPYDATISGPFEVRGSLRQLQGSAQLELGPAREGPAVRGQVGLNFNSATRKIDLGHSVVDLPHSHVEATGTLGESLQVKLDSGDAGDLLPFLPGERPDLAFGALHFEGTVQGPLEHPRVAGFATAQTVRFEKQHLDAVAGDFTLNENQLAIRKSEANFAGIPCHVIGNIELKNWLLTPKSTLNGTVDLTGSELSKVLAVAGEKDIPVTGMLSGTAKVTGSVGDPRAAGDLTLAKGQIYGQPFDSISGHAQVVDRKAATFTGLFISGAKRVNISTRFDQASEGRVEFNLTSNTMPLNEIHLVRERQPDIHGFGKFHADGVLRIARDRKNEQRVDLESLNADASANDLELTGRNLGNARLLAQTKDGVLVARFDSNAANASIHGDGTMRLNGDYPLEGKVKFSNAGLNSLITLILKADSPAKPNFDGTAEGELNFRGPARKPELIAGTLDIPKIELHALPGTDFARALPNYNITNKGPIQVSVTSQAVRFESARLQAPQTDLALSGSIGFTGQQPLGLRVQGNMNMALARSLSSDITAEGQLSLDGTIRGNWSAPLITGRASIKNGEFHFADFSNGLANANGEIAFNGTRATIQSLTAESGGGRVDVSGFTTLNNGLLAFRLEAKSRGVRVRYPEGVSSISDADITLAGTQQRSEVSGSISIHRVAINPKSDAATILSAAAEPLKTASVQNTLASNMNLDVQISTAPDVALQTSVTQSLQADANLRLRGTVTNPAVLGRINITQGEIVFFGNKYSINQGTVSFFNPSKIEPILNVDLETKARGVDVILTLSGPVNKLNVTYRSDPPLQFSDIVALLATGRTPNDPTLALGSSGQSQGFQQLGANTLIGQAIANPVAGRLQRFFGVSRIKIDPQLTGITGSPQARLTIEQQVTPEILFTYITDVSSTSTQLIRVEWAFNRNWSAVLIREENGYVGLDFTYKKRFK